MNETKTVQRFLKLSSAGVAVLGAARGLSRALPVAIGGIVVLASLDRWVELAPWGRQAVWALFAIGAAVGFVSGFMPFRLFSLFERSKNLSMRNPGLRPDDLRIAAEFSLPADSLEESEGVSSELREAFLSATSQKLASSNPMWCFPHISWKKQLSVAAAALLMAGSLRAFFPSMLPVNANTLFPFWSFEIERKLQIEPGDAGVPFGKDASIRVTLLEPGSGKPVLKVKSGEQWLEIDAALESDREFTYVIKALVSPLQYRVGWRGQWSRRFTLTPLQPLSAVSFAIRLAPPDYTGKAAFDQTTPEISGLAGTQVEMAVTVSEKISQATLTFSDRREITAEKISGDVATFRFVLTSAGSYGFTVTPEGGAAAPLDAVYPLHVTEDKAPTITLLSPDQDVVIGEKEKLPVTYDARDDYGLGEIALEWETAQGAKKRRRVATFDKPRENSLETYQWDLALEQFAPGQVARFRVGAQDKNKVTGPGEAWSEWRILEIRSFEREHAAIEKALENWRDKAIETLAQVTTLQKKVESENADMNALANEFNAPQKNLDAMNDALKQILNKMEQDPLADYGVWLEHKAMQENLELMTQTTAKNARAAFQTQNKKAASEHLDSIGKELERMSALSEDLSKAQKARDVTQAGENLEEIGDDLMRALENAKGDKEMAAKINQLLAEAQKNLMDMAQALQQMPEDLPDDFINQEAIKNLDLNKSQDLLGQIAEAVKQGDMQRAMALAQKFAAAAKAMRSQLSKAHESFLKSNSASELEKKIAEQAKELEQVTADQRQLLSETQKLASKQMDAVMKEQEDLLAALAERQEKVAALAKQSPQLRNQGPFMDAVAAEFRAKRVDKSPEWLSSIVLQAQLARAELVRSSASAEALSIAIKVQEEETAILETIKNPPAPKRQATSEQQRAFADLSERQKNVRKKTQDVKQQLQVLSRKTAGLGGQLMQSLSRASGEMKDAADHLADKNGVGAQRSEERALDELLQSQSQLQQAQSAMSDMAMDQGGGQDGGEAPGEGQGRGRGGPKVIHRNGPGMGRGQQIGKVKLPDADDYRAPKAFREDLLESLKENYPKIYEDIIHNYYKRLAQ